MSDADTAVPVTPAPTTPEAHEGSRLSAAWASAVAAVVILVLLIIFILQNDRRVTVHYLGLSGRVSLGVAMFIAAVAGAALVALVGFARLVQARVRRRRLAKAAKHS